MITICKKNKKSYETINTLTVKISKNNDMEMKIEIPSKIFSIIESFNGIQIKEGGAIKINSDSGNIMVTPEFLEGILTDTLNPLRFFIEKILILYNEAIKSLNKINIEIESDKNTKCQLKDTIMCETNKRILEKIEKDFNAKFEYEIQPYTPGYFNPYYVIYIDGKKTNFTICAEMDKSATFDWEKEIRDILFSQIREYLDSVR